MKKKAKKKILPVVVAALAMVAIASAPALAKDSKKSSSHSSAAAAASANSYIPEAGHASKMGEHDTKPGPAWKTVGGTVKQINGSMYTVEDYEGNQVQLVVGQGTKQLRGQKKVGDTIRAEITRGGFANSVQ